MDFESGDLDTQTKPERVVLLGMRCAFTEPVLEALLGDPGVALQAVVLPDAAHATNADPVGDAVFDLARRNGIFIHNVDGRSSLNAPHLRAALEAVAPGLIVAACFPWRLPGWLRSLPTHGCLNIHPSLLPDGRGPEPVYWAFRWALEETGVSLHLMDDHFDTGPILAQRRCAIPVDATLESLERDLAGLGARLLIDTLPSLIDGTAAATPQSTGLARPAPMPGSDDLVVSTSWSAQRAARFIRAVAPTYGPLTVLVQASGQRLAIGTVIAIDDGATLPGPVRLVGTEAQIRFTSGVLTCQLDSSSQPLRIHPTARNHLER